MKKTFFTLAVAVLLAGTMISGCQTSAEKVKIAEDKVQDAQNKVVEAQLNLDQALKDSIQQFKKESEDQIVANDKSIAEFKAKIDREKVELRARDERRLAELERQNVIMKQRLEEFREDSKENWVTFRDKFNHDMKQMGTAFHDFWAGKK